MFLARDIGLHHTDIEDCNNSNNNNAHNSRNSHDHDDNDDNDNDSDKNNKNSNDNSVKGNNDGSRRRGGRTSSHVRHIDSTPTTHMRRRRRRANYTPSIVLSALLLSSMSVAMAQDCVSLAGSTACPAFSSASVSTNANLTSLFPFLSAVSDTASFDAGLQNYIAGDFPKIRYEQLIGCSNYNQSNTAPYYARYTTSVLCNAIVQNSVEACSLRSDSTDPLCADSCARYAQSEQAIAASSACSAADEDGLLTQIRADFTNCALPSRSIANTCIDASDNQPTNCGFSTNLVGLCTYCAASSPNSTDSCCVFSNSTGRCQGVELPVVAASSLASVTFTLTSQADPTHAVPGLNAAATNDGSAGLSRGAVVGIVIGSILGAVIILAAIIAGCLLFKRRRYSSPAASIFNQPAPGRIPSEMGYHDGARDPPVTGLAITSGARVARMSALEDSSGSDHYVPCGLDTYKEDEGEDDDLVVKASNPPKRSGSLSNSLHLAAVAAATAAEDAHDTSQSSNGEFTSPESQARSEQLDFFKDYYSQDEIRPGDLVATLWAYEPRAADEFQLERGDMIKVIGIWDDGWATGVRARQKAEDWRPVGEIQRDSGLSTRLRADSSAGGEVKAFPLVCVCLPENWRKTIEGESTEGSGSGNRRPGTG